MLEQVLLNLDMNQLMVADFGLSAILGAVLPAIIGGIAGKRGQSPGQSPMPMQAGPGALFSILQSLLSGEQKNNTPAAPQVPVTNIPVGGMGGGPMMPPSQAPQVPIADPNMKRPIGM